MVEREKGLVLVFDKPNFVVKLYEYVLEVDLKEGVKKELEEFLEAKSFRAHALGFIFQTIVPLDVWLKDIESATMDEEGGTKIVILHQKDITIPLPPNESKKLISKLNELVPIAKQKDLEEREIRKKLHFKI